MKEQLVEMTGLSPRVIRVWFQNKRCKDKKRMILTKQMEQQAKVSESRSAESSHPGIG
jgi:insulin gene enhancer protein ISL-1